MMNLAIFRKTLSDSCSTLLAAALGLTAFVVVFVWAMLNMGTELMEFISKFGFLRRIFEMSLGISLEGEVSVNTLFAVSFTHAVSLTLCWTVVIAAATRVTAGEVERGNSRSATDVTVDAQSNIFVDFTRLVVGSAGDVLLPVGRHDGQHTLVSTRRANRVEQVYCPHLQFRLPEPGSGRTGDARWQFVKSSGPSDCRRGRDGPALSAVLNFLEPFLEVVKNIRFLGLLSYFRPVDIARSGIWPWSSMGSLLLLAAFCWIFGLIVFCRKDIPTA